MRSSRNRERNASLTGLARNPRGGDVGGDRRVSLR